MPTLQSGFPVSNIAAGARTSITQAITVAAGNNRALLVATAHENSAGNVSGITANAVALTFLDRTAATTWSHVEMWLLYGPAVGTYNVVASKASVGSNQWGLGIYAFNDVDPLVAPKIQKASSDSGAASSLTLTGLNGDEFLVDILSIDSTGHNAQVGADQTLGYEGDYGAGSNETHGSRQPVVGDGVMSWTWTTAAPFSHMAVALPNLQTLPDSNTGYGDGTYGDGTYGVRTSADSTPPTVNVTTGTGKISDETGKDSYAYSFTVDEAVQAWEVRVVANASDPRGSGTLVESGGAASGTISGSITYAELNAAGQGAEGQKILKFFAQDTAGNWST